MNRKGMKYRGYVEEDVIAAIADVRDRKISVNKAAIIHHVPRNTLKRKLNGEPINMKTGPAPYLSNEVENELAKKLIFRERCGYPLDRQNFCNIAKDLATSLGLDPASENIVFGQRWFQLFLKRHPEIKMETGSGVSKNRADITEEEDRAYLADLRQYLLQRNNNSEKQLAEMLSDPSRFINLEESDLKFIGDRQRKHLDEKGEASKIVRKSAEEGQQTVLMGFDAAGNMCPPIILYNLLSLPSGITSTIPARWHALMTTGRWMESPAFLQSLKIVVEWATKRNVTFPIVIFVNNRASHISFEISDYCMENNVILYLLYPNCTAFLQPAGLTLFARIKNEWCSYLGKDNRNINSVIPQVNHHNFAVHLKFVMDKIEGLPELCREAFRASGLYPLNPDNVNYQFYKMEHITKANETDLHEQSTENGNQAEPITTVKQVVCEMLQALNLKDQALFIKSIKCGKYHGPKKHKSLFVAWKLQVQKIIDVGLEWIPSSISAEYSLVESSFQIGDGCSSDNESNESDDGSQIKKDCITERISAMNHHLR